MTRLSEVTRACIFGCDAAHLGADERAFFSDADPFGFILFARNVQTPDQVRRLTGDLRASVGRDAPVLVDQEGGRVQRLRGPHWRNWRAPLDQMQTARDAFGAAAANEAMRLRYRLIAHELFAVGIDVNCAPTADIAGHGTHPFLRDRCYAGDVAGVTAAARAVADGLLAGGVLPVIKHMPGHGRAAVDSHHHLPCVTEGLGVLDATDFAVFAALADVPIGMTGHIVFSSADPVLPATASPAVIALIRERIGFGGLLITDDIGMQALSGTISQRAEAAVSAGCDVVLHCNGDLAERRAVAAALGPMTPAATARADAALARRGVPEPLDVAAAEARLHALLGGRVYV